MNSAKYWEEREIAERLNIIKDEAKLNKKIDKLYKDIFKSIEKDIFYFFQKYAKDNKLTYKEATKYLTSNEFSKWRMDLKEYIELISKTGDEHLLLELNTLAAKSRISRLEQLIYQVNKQVDSNFEYMRKTTKVLMEKSVINSYKDSAKNINYIYGINAKSNISKERVKDILIQPWSGTIFSDSIWENRNRLVKVVQNELTKGLYQGKSSQKICTEISKRVEGSKNDIMRIVRTERTYAQNKAKLEQYKDVGFKKYKYKAAIEQNKTCDKCRKIHKEAEKKPLDISKAIVGINFPPLHPNCRCTVVPYIED